MAKKAIASLTDLVIQNPNLTSLKQFEGLKQQLDEREEVWKVMVDFPNYKISNFGRIKTIHRLIPHNILIGRMKTLPEKLMRQYHSIRGYMALNICDSGKVKRKMVHRLVAEAFVDNPDNKPFVNHLDGNKLNNHVSNLEWCTHQENCLHAYSAKLRTPRPFTDKCMTNIKLANSKKVIDTKTGIVYDSVRLAAEAFNLNKSTLQYYLTDKHPNTTNLKYLNK